MYQKECCHHVLRLTVGSCVAFVKCSFQRFLSHEIPVDPVIRAAVHTKQTDLTSSQCMMQLVFTEETFRCCYNLVLFMYLFSICKTFIFKTKKINYVLIFSVFILYLFLIFVCAFVILLVILLISI